MNYISGKHLKGQTLAEVMALGPLMPNYTLRLSLTTGDEPRISSARYVLRDDGKSSIETKVVEPPGTIDLNERTTIIDKEKNASFRTLRRLYIKLLPESRERFEPVFKFLLKDMTMELVRTARRRKK